MLKVRRDERNEDLPRLHVSDVPALHAAGALPDRWRTLIDVSYMRPLLPPGATVTLVRREPRPGDVVCLLSSTTLVWRRVVGGRPGALTVRADIAPHSERWAGDVLGCVVDEPPPSWVARRLPTLWTGGVWHSALAIAHLRGLRARTRPRREERINGLVVRALTEADLSQLNDFGRRVMGLEVDIGRPPHGAVVVGAFTAAGELIGHGTVHTNRSPPHTSNLYVNARYRGAGVGRLIVRERIVIARRLGASELRTSIRARNLASVRAHQAAGYQLLYEAREPNNYPEYQTWSVRLT